MAKRPPPPPKQRGSVDRIPGQRKIKASIRAIIADIVERQPLTVRKAVIEGLRSDPRTSHHFIKIAAEQLDGQKVVHTFDMDELAEAHKSLHQKLDMILKRGISGS